MTPLTAFDADVLIYAAARNHRLGAPVTALFQGVGPVGVGSVLLLPEVLAKPVRDDPESPEVAALLSRVSRLELRPLDEPTSRLALVLGAKYGLRAADAAHLATGVAAGADRYLTDNRRDFPQSMLEIDVLYPDQLSGYV